MAKYVIIKLTDGIWFNAGQPEIGRIDVAKRRLESFAKANHCKAKLVKVISFEKGCVEVARSDFSRDPV